MRRRCLDWFTALALFIQLTACNGRSPEERINEAMPVGAQVQTAADSLLQVAAEGGRDVAPLAAEVGHHYSMRAVKCAGDYKPGLFDDASNIAIALKDKADCFREQDADLLAWVMEKRIGVVLAAPPLIAKPASLPSLSVPLTPMHTQFAKHAGVLFTSDLLSGEYEVLNVTNGKALATGRASGSGSLSDNGRLFVTVQRSGRDSLTEIHETATGKVLLATRELQWFDWIRDIGAIVIQTPATGRFDGAAQHMFRDMSTGLDTPLSLPEPTRQLRMPGGSDRIVLTQRRGLVPLTLARTGNGWTARVDPPYEETGYHVDMDAGVTADGKHYVFALGTGLKILDLDSGALRSVSLQPFVVLNMQPTPDPDRVLLTGHYGRPAIEESERLLYSLSRGTAAVVPIANEQESVVWVPEYSALMGSGSHKLYPVTAEAAGPEMDMASLVALRKPELEKRMLAKQAAMAAAPAFDPQAVAAAMASRPDATTGVIAGPVAELAKRARVLAVGVYEGKRYPGDSRGGTVRVSVMRTQGPIILVLASYEDVRWVVTADPGAEIGAVLVSGYKPAEVMGVQAPVYRIGSSYTYGSDGGGGDRNALNREVTHWAGKDIDSLQGTYQGDLFVIRE